MTRNILIIDDEPNMRWVLAKALEQAGYVVAAAATGDEGLSLLASTPIELVLLDLKLRSEDGITVLRRLRERRPDIVVMMLTAHGTVSNAVEAMQLGAADFLRKPFDVEEIVFKVARALERRSLQQQVARLTMLQKSESTFASLIGSDPSWQQAIVQAEHLAPLNLNVLITGEHGSGRRTIARAIHGASLRSASPLIEAELGAYTDPKRALFGIQGTEGLWDRAGNGTIILRDVLANHEMLEAITERIVTAPVPPRVIVLATAEEASSTNANNLTSARVDVPPLRKRPSDIVLLAQFFAEGAAMSPRAIQQLELYHWPGNVTELRGVIQRARALAGEQLIDLVHLPRQIVEGVQPTTSAGFQLPLGGVNLEEVEQQLIRQALVEARGNKSKAAELLGLTRHTLLYRMEKYNIQVPE